MKKENFNVSHVCGIGSCQAEWKTSRPKYFRKTYCYGFWPVIFSVASFGAFNPSGVICFDCLFPMLSTDWMVAWSCLSVQSWSMKRLKRPGIVTRATHRRPCWHRSSYRLVSEAPMDLQPSEKSLLLKVKSRAWRFGCILVVYWLADVLDLLLRLPSTFTAYLWLAFLW